MLLQVVASVRLATFGLNAAFFMTKALKAVDNALQRTHLQGLLSATP